MTGFLCALGGVCLQQRSTPSIGTYSPPMGPMSERKGSMISMGSCEVNSETPLSRFLERLLSLMVCTHEKVGLHIRTNVKDLLGLELSPALYSMLFTKLRNSIGRFFDTQGPVGHFVVTLSIKSLFRIIWCGHPFNVFSCIFFISLHLYMFSSKYGF